MINLVVAYGKKREIGINNRLPWRIPEDLKNFKALTMGGVLLMGRKTFDSIGRALPGRKTIVLTRSKEWSHPDVETAGSLEEAFDKAESAGTEIFVVGGSEIYRQALPLCQRLFLSRVEWTGEADAFFPLVEGFQKKEEVYHPETEKSPPWTFETWVRES